jgi:hypothetical protein
VAVDAPTAAPAVYLPPQQPQASDHGNGNGNGHNK